MCETCALRSFRDTSIDGAYMRMCRLLDNVQEHRIRYARGKL